jgi:ATP phosphoribosyltransferase
MLRIALPNKGRLAAGALELLAQAGLPSEPAAERALQASLGGGELLALFMRAKDIPELVADGAADVGITGRDLLEESARPLEVALDLLFGRCRLAVAVREDSAAGSVADLPPGTRVATTFPRLTTRHFRARGREVTLVPLSGAAEIAPHLGVADAIVDLVSTGSTLRTNGLRELEPVLESTALLVARPQVAASADGACELGRLAAALESVLRARDKRYLMANVPRASLEATRRILPGITGPTVVDLLDGNGHVAVHAVVDQGDIYRVIAELKGIGAEGILVTRIERLMP